MPTTLGITMVRRGSVQITVLTAQKNIFGACPAGEDWMSLQGEGLVKFDQYVAKDED